MPPSAERPVHSTLDKPQHAILISIYSTDPASHSFFFNFNIPEIEMGLAIDDKKAPCHSLIGGIFFSLGKYMKV